MPAPSSPTSPSPPLRLVDSVAELTAADAGCWAITGSHGGLSAARYALAVRPALVVFNDAGVGLRQAGIAGLAELGPHSSEKHAQRNRRMRRSGAKRPISASSEPINTADPTNMGSQWGWRA